MLDQRLFYLGWQITLPGMAGRFWQLVERFGSPQAAWNANEKQLISIGGLTSEVARELFLRRLGVNPEAEMSFLENKGFGYSCFSDDDYPEILKNISQPPPGLFLKGKLDLKDKPTVAIVGSRKASPYGVSVARDLASEIAGSGVVVVSGLAMGIDAAAHGGALSAGGKTIAVLGCGLDIPYPKSNISLKEKIGISGAAVSEFPLGMKPESWHFPYRNRIISGLSRIVVVVEAAVKSGALITVDFALDQGRDVMAVPGNINSELSRGTNSLIQQGAMPVQNGQDILEELNIEFNSSVKKKDLSHKSLDSDQQIIIKLILSGVLGFEELVEHSGMAANKAMAALTFLEVSGIIKQINGRKYHVCQR
ncbi:MAG: DNA-protecting protein DprA [Peptococcaceae bacterium]|nr:DNA-protecting protein DprA [Peptococcaceae bacterium]